MGKLPKSVRKVNTLFTVQDLKRLGGGAKGLNYAMGNEDQVEPIRDHEGKQEQDTMSGINQNRMCSYWA